MGIELDLKRAIAEGNWDLYERLLARIDPNPRSCPIVGEDGWKGTVLTLPPRIRPDAANTFLNPLNPYPPKEATICIHWDNGVLEHILVSKWDGRSIRLQTLALGERVVKRGNSIIRWKSTNLARSNRIGWFFFAFQTDWSTLDIPWFVGRRPMGDEIAHVLIENHNMTNKVLMDLRIRRSVDVRDLQIVNGYIV